MSTMGFEQNASRLWLNIFHRWATRFTLFASYSMRNRQEYVILYTRSDYARLPSFYQIEADFKKNCQTQTSQTITCIEFENQDLINLNVINIILKYQSTGSSKIECLYISRDIFLFRFWGGYSNIEYGYIHDTYLSLTGGVYEAINLERTRMKPGDIYYRIKRAIAQGAQVGCAVSVSLFPGHTLLPRKSTVCQLINKFSLINITCLLKIRICQLINIACQLINRVCLL